jgi:large subunit ribosomal protein L9
LKEFEEKREELEKIAKENLAAANKRKEKLDGFTIKITAEANEEGQLFGSIGPYEIEKQLVDSGLEVTRQEIRMPDGAIKKIGEYPVNIHLGIETDAIVNLIVESNNQS